MTIFCAFVKYLDDSFGNLIADYTQIFVEEVFKDGLPIHELLCYYTYNRLFCIDDQVFYQLSRKTVSVMISTDLRSQSWLAYHSVVPWSSFRCLLDYQIRS
jgi:hypothetical protein